MAVIIMQECELYQYTLFTGSILLLASLFFNIKYRKKIKKRLEDENRLIKNAYYHPVTSLPNKENVKIVISEQIQRALRHNKSFLVMVIKIKNFHEVQLHSKVLAEEFMLEASNRLLQSTRSEDIIGHISDDSFIIVFNEYLQEENYRRVCQRVEESFAQAPELNTKYTIDFKVSIGTSVYPDGAVNPDALMEKARKAAIDRD
ncbi:GGDEF domain-containing protein [Sulfurimonas hydrogeniphila]|uniref:GGDEF domain-containing protein n=1 Tax=Sulfurimonas hydrogeniphila TaxID=2509341 RepID=UPI001E56268B|nr:diguanylate cyclase [Sulfurimonas hydrogeniphila]